MSDLLSLLGWLSANLPVPLTIAVTLACMTVLSFSLLNASARDEVALWLMGGHAEGWSQTFTRLFDALFGRLRTTLPSLLNTFLRSAVASLAAVGLMWGLMGGTDLLGDRAGEDLPLATLLTVAVAVNVVVDYF